MARSLATIAGRLGAGETLEAMRHPLAITGLALLAAAAGLYLACAPGKRQSAAAVEEEPLGIE
jgi:hypothetical protein